MVDSLSSLRRRWPQWVRGDPLRHWCARGRRFRGVVAAWPGDAMHVVTIVLVAGMEIARDDSDGGGEARIRYYVY